MGASFLFVQVYDYFTSRFDNNVSSYGRVRMAADVARLKQKNEELMRKCSARPVESGEMQGKQQADLTYRQVV